MALPEQHRHRIVNACRRDVAMLLHALQCLNKSLLECVVHLFSSIDAPLCLRKRQTDAGFSTEIAAISPHEATGKAYCADFDQFEVRDGIPPISLYLTFGSTAPRTASIGWGESHRDWLMQIARETVVGRTKADPKAPPQPLQDLYTTVVNRRRR